MSFHTGKSLAKIGENKQKRAEVFFVFVFFLLKACVLLLGEKQLASEGNQCRAG